MTAGKSTKIEKRRSSYFLTRGHIHNLYLVHTILSFTCNYTCTHTHTDAHAHTHTHTHTLTHTLTHTALLIYSCCCCSLIFIGSSVGSPGIIDFTSSLAHRERRFLGIGPSALFSGTVEGERNKQRGHVIKQRDKERVWLWAYNSDWCTLCVCMRHT